MSRLENFNQIARQHCNVNEIDQLRRNHLLKRREKELKSKIEQINHEIEGELNDFYDYLYQKQASVETLSTIKNFLEEQLKDIQIRTQVESVVESKGEAS